MHFNFPINGDCVNSRDALVQDGTLLLPVRISAPAGHDIRICGKEAVYENGAYRADVPILGYRNTLTAEDITDGTSCRIAVYYMPAAEGCFRISSDDNILFLQDITAHQDTYRSIFENPYLAVYKKAHDLFGAKVHLNLFYEFVPTYSRMQLLKEKYSTFRLLHVRYCVSDIQIIADFQKCLIQITFHRSAGK